MLVFRRVVRSRSSGGQIRQGLKLRLSTLQFDLVTANVFERRSERVNNCVCRSRGHFNPYGLTHVCRTLDSNL